MLLLKEGSCVPENLYTVTKVIPNFHKIGGDTMELMQTMRASVSQAREENPFLAGCSLQDVGFIQQSDGLEIKLYFTQEGLTT